MSNQLGTETSPYLLQHAENPVHWRAWSEAAQAEARAAGKPILLSIGYSACHWCHVMAHESFEDATTAELMNELFVNIKVDREERPDIDKTYQLAHQLLNGRGGGWPLTAFLTPQDLVPIFVGTYFPREPRYGMPAFRDVLVNVARYYQEHGDAVKRTGTALRDALASLSAPASESSPGLHGAPLGQARRALADSFDSEHGGMVGAPKFPHPTQLEFLLATWRASAESRNPDLEALRMTALTLTRMAERGVYDHIGGGFFRYSVDHAWRIPHFEKMLYDNAQLLRLYAEAHAATGEPLFARAAQETAAWAKREMSGPEGAYCAALDADSEGEEGRFYVWTRDEFEAALQDDERCLLARYFGLTSEPNFEAHYWHLQLTEPLEQAAAACGLAVAAAPDVLAQGRARLLRQRVQRAWPQRDEKILTAWNGLMIRSLAVAARGLGMPDLAADAAAAVDFIAGNLWRAGRLMASYKDGQARFPAYLDDYAFLAAALVELLQTRWRTTDLAFAIDLVEVLLTRFADPAGGFFFTADDQETVLQRLKPYQDEAIPSGNGVAASVLIRLGHLLAEPRYLDAAERLLMNAWPQLERYPAAHCSLLDALRDHTEPPTVVVMRGEPEALEGWQRYLNAGYHPRRLAFCIPDDATDLPGQLANFTARATPVAYICRGTHCEAPIESLEELLARLGHREVAP